MTLKSTAKYSTIPQLFMEKLFSYHGLLLLNLIFLTVMAFSLVDMTNMLMNGAEETEEVERIMTGLATLFVAYGVALEERGFLMKIVGCYPQNQTSRQMYIDHISHHYGVLLLIVGLMVEVGVQIIKIPDRFTDVINFEGIAYAMGFLSFLMIGYWLICFCYKLLKKEEISSSITSNT